MDIRPSIRKGNSAGLVTTTAGNDLIHTLSVNRSGVIRSAIIRKILVFNNTGGNVTIQFGTRDASAVPLFVQYLPDLLALNGLENTWSEDVIPAVEFGFVDRLTINGREGNIYALASAANVLISVEVEEFGI
jgi:hypothetical protein